MRESYEGKRVDIIIPIYNAYEDLTKCLESVYKHTDLEKNRLILVNDNSPDERIKPFLEQQTEKKAIVFHNDSNKGFSNNVNLGIMQSTANDVILLNSDTVVTERWIEKILECAYSDGSIGTVTPLSNNATLCSVPEFCEENTLPEYLDIDHAGRIVEQCSMKKYPRITVAHGFCMFIKREVIDAIGYFDAETFELGYGEENDFCNRAEQAGYHHVMCDNTYIFHSGTKSFVSKEKEKYIMLHDRILRERYPKQMHLNDVHVRDNPNGFVGDNVGIYFDLENGKKNILYVLQSDFRKGATDNVGGTQFHVRDLVSVLRDEYNVFVAARNGQYLNLTVYYGGQEKEFRFFIGAKRTIYEFRNKKLENLWENILAAFHIDLVHVHHVINTSFDIFYVAEAYKIPIILTLHDFYFVCPSVTLTRDDDVCDVCCLEKDMDCRECLKSNKGITDQIDYIKIWRKKCAEALCICKSLIIPDAAVSNIFLSYYPFIKDRLEVIEHGYAQARDLEREVMCSKDAIVMYERVSKEGFSYKIEGWTYLKEKNGNTGETIYLQIENGSGAKELIPATKVNRPDVIADSKKSKVGFSCVIPQNLLDGGNLRIRVALDDNGKLIYTVDIFETPDLPVSETKLNVAFIGGLNKAKGGEIVNEIVENCCEDVNWYVFGGIGVEELMCQKRDNLVKTGYYMPDDLPALLRLHEIDVICILSIWPETYSYTLTEAVMNGIPVIVTDVGALGRRVREMQCGWTIPLEHLKDSFLDIVKGLVKDRSPLESYRKMIDKVRIPDIMEMGSRYKKLYAGFGDIEVEYPDADYVLIFEGYKVDSWQRQDGSICSDGNVETNVCEQADEYYKFKRYLQNNHPRLYILLRRIKGHFGKRAG